MFQNGPHENHWYLMNGIQNGVLCISYKIYKKGGCQDTFECQLTIIANIIAGIVQTSDVTPEQKKHSTVNTIDIVR